MLKILHTGDIHLDCPFSSLDTRQAEIRRNELRAAFTSMMMYARMNQVNLMLIAGDLFDNRYVTRETIALLKSEFEKMSCPIVITPGNHDCAGEKSIWRKNVFPPNVHIFTEETLNLIDSEIKAIITKAYDECKALLIAHKDKLKEVAEYLIENEKISGEDFEKLMNGELNPAPADNSDVVTDEVASDENGEIE